MTTVAKFTTVNGSLLVTGSGISTFSSTCEFFCSGVPEFSFVAGLILRQFGRPMIDTEPQS